MRQGWLEARQEAYRVAAARQLQEKGSESAARLSDELSQLPCRGPRHPKTGEIYARGRRGNHREVAEGLNEHGYKELPLLDIDHVNVGAYIRNTLHADKNMTRETRCFDHLRVLRSR